MTTRQLGVFAASIIILSFGIANIAGTASNNATVEQRLQKLEDTEAIRTLLIAYGRALDKRDFKEYGELFAKNGTWKGGMGSATTPVGIQKMVEDGFSRMSPELYENSHHVMTSLDVQVNGDSAKSWSRWMWVVHGSDGRPRTERSGYYEDTLVREDGAWKFMHRQAFTEITE